MRREPKAFVSSTYFDLKKHRAHVIRALRRSGIHVDPMEDWTADDAEPMAFSQSRIEGCDLCILLVAFRRGYIPDGETLSITQMEYIHARKHGIKVLVFLLDEDAMWQRKFDELDEDPETGQWREQLAKGHGAEFFDHNVESLNVLPAVMRWKHEQAINADDPDPDMVEACLDLEKYGQALLLKYSRVHLDNVDVTGAYYDGVKLWDVFVPQAVRECLEYYPQILEIPKEHQQRLRDQGEWTDAELHTEFLENRRQTYLDQPLRNVLELGDDSRLHRVVILGDPGSGKSALLRYLALRWARLEASELLDRPIPILIELRDYDNWSCSDGKNFLRYLSEAQTWYRIDRTVMDALAREQGRTVLLLDGLDEIFDLARRKRVIDEIQRFALDFPHTRIVVTSRVIGYTPQTLQDAEFRHFMLQDLEDEQMQTFLERWHEQTFDDTEDRDRKQARLAKALGESRPIRELGGNPLLLTMMAILNRHQELPRYRAELYYQASKLLLHQWDTSRFRKSHTEPDESFDYHDKAAMLQRVADHMQANRQGLSGNIISSQDLNRHLGNYLREKLGFDVQQARGYARSLIEQLRERNFVLCYLGAESYGFVHRTFLEYFCASAIVYRFKEEQSLSIDELIHDIFGQHWYEEAWHEVLCLICGMIDARFVGQILEYLLSQEDKDFTFTHIFLAARCYGDVRNPGSLQTERTRLRDALLPLLHFGESFANPDEDEQERARKRDKIYQQTVGYLVQLRLVDDVREWLVIRTISDDHPVVRCTAVQELARGFKDDPETLPWLKQRADFDERWDVRQTAVQELARGFKDDPETLPWLKQRANSGENEWVRHAAVQELAQGFKADPDTLPILKRLANFDDHEWVRRAALQELARRFGDDPKTLPILKQRANSDDHKWVLRAAVQELAREFKDDPETLPWLKQQLNFNNNQWVRQAAVQELSQGFKDDPETLPWLKQLAMTDNNADVRQAAVQELARGFKDDPETLPILKQRTQSDNASDVRRAAVQELARGFKDYPETLPILKRLAKADGDEDVRRVAVQELARGFKDDPDTLPILKQRACSDDNGWVRRAAVHEIASGFKDDLETPLILKQRTGSDDNYAVRQSALQALAQSFRDDPDTLPILKQLAQTDEDEDVRRAAVQELARRFKDDPETLPILKQRACTDDDGWVRRAAVQELARGFKDDPETISFLIQKAKSDDNWAVDEAAIQELTRGFKEDPEVQKFLASLRQ